MNNARIGGSIFVRRAIRYDYCIEAAITSLLGVCDEVVVVDCQSDDGTYEMLWEMKEKEKRIKLHRHPWVPVAGRNGAWLADVANYAREALTADYHVGLQADEVLHSGDYNLIREAATTGAKALVKRLNFWLDHRHLLPEGEKVGSKIVRLAPKHAPWWGDAESLRPDGTEIDLTAITIFHYGFIRKLDSFIERSVNFQDEWHGFHDPLFDRMRTEGRKPLEDHFPKERLVEFRGTHPKAAHQWLTERGYTDE